MDISAKRNPVRKRGWGSAVFFLTSALAVSLLCAHEEKRTDTSVFYREEYGVVCGILEMTGEEGTWHRNTLLQVNMMLASLAHTFPDDFPASDTRSVRAMVGSFLPTENKSCLARSRLCFV